jgi:hypothetical protein
MSDGRNTQTGETKMDSRTQDEKENFAILAANKGTARVYFYDIDTREEVTLGSNEPGLPVAGRLPCGIRDGARYMDTCLGINVLDFEKRLSRVVTAEDFPGRRVAAKTWRKNWEHETEVEWTFLVSKSNGWMGNAADDGNLKEKNLGPAARMEK